MQYLQIKLVSLVGLFLMAASSIVPQAVFAFQAEQFFYTYSFPSNSTETSDLLKDLESSTWHSLKAPQTHFGFNNQQIIIKVIGQAQQPSGQQATSLMLDARYLDRVTVYAETTNTNPGVKAPLIKLLPAISLGFKSSHFYNLPPDTTTLYITAASKSALLVPIIFMTAEQAHSDSRSATWSLGIFFGLAFFALLVCIFQYRVLKQTALGLVCAFLMTQMLYVISKSNMHLFVSGSLSRVLLENLASPLTQLGLITILAILALYIQRHSNESIVAQALPLKFKKLFHSNVILIIVSLLALLATQNAWLQTNLFRNWHLSAFTLAVLLLFTFISAFVLCSIASGLTHKHSPVQGYLLLTWLTTGSSILLEGSEFLGAPYSNFIHFTGLKDLSSLFISLNVIFLTFWVITQSALVQKARLEAMQHLFDGLAHKNRDIEINLARTSDLAKTIYRDVKKPILKIVNILKKLPDNPPNKTLIQQVRHQLRPLNESLQRLIMLSQDINHTIQAQHIPFNLHNLFERIPLAFRQRALSQHVALHLEIDQLLPEQARGDQSLLLKALMLIVEHRLHNLRHGAIRIFVTRANDVRSPKIVLAIRIEDSGATNTQLDVEQFWDHSPKLDSRDFQLMLAQDMIFAMGGEFIASHEPASGNCITCQLTLDRVYTTTESNAETDTVPDSQAIRVQLSYPGRNSLVIGKTDQFPRLEMLLMQHKMIVHRATTASEIAATLVIEQIDILFIEGSTVVKNPQLLQSIQKLQLNTAAAIIILAKADEHQLDTLTALSGCVVLTDLTLDNLQSVLAETLG